MHTPEIASEPHNVTLGTGLRSVAGVPTHIHFQTAEEAAVGRDTVLMEFKQDVLLDNRIYFQAGIRPVPVELQDHWYLKAHGVTLAGE